MGNYTTATVLVSESKEKEKEMSSPLDGLDRLGKAKRMFREFEDHEFYYHNVEANEDLDRWEIPLNSEEGQERLAEQMERTAAAKERYLSKIMEVVEEHDTLREAAEDYDVFHNARRLGMYPQPDSAYLYDATHWTHGDPIINQERVDKILNHFDNHDFYLIELELAY